MAILKNEKGGTLLYRMWFCIKSVRKRQRSL
jgi:hypothetical protein